MNSPAAEPCPDSTAGILKNPVYSKDADYRKSTILLEVVRLPAVSV